MGGRSATVVIPSHCPTTLLNAITSDVIVGLTRGPESGFMNPTQHSQETYSNPVTATTGGSLLRSSLKLDSVVSAANGITYIAGAAILDDLLGASTPWLLGIGAFLIIYAIEVAVVGTRDPINRTHAGLIAEGNLVWVAGSVSVVAFGWLDLTTTGEVWALMQAAVVGGFAALQFVGLRRA